MKGLLGLGKGRVAGKVDDAVRASPEELAVVKPSVVEGAIKAVPPPGTPVNITMPDGSVMKNVPYGTPREDVEVAWKKAISGDLATYNKAMSDEVQQSPSVLIQSIGGNRANVFSDWTGWVKNNTRDPKLKPLMNNLQAKFNEMQADFGMETEIRLVSPNDARIMLENDFNLVRPLGQTENVAAQEIASERATGILAHTTDSTTGRITQTIMLTEHAASNVNIVAHELVHATLSSMMYAARKARSKGVASAKDSRIIRAVESLEKNKAAYRKYLVNAPLEQLSDVDQAAYKNLINMMENTDEFLTYYLSNSKARKTLENTKISGKMDEAFEELLEASTEDVRVLYRKVQQKAGGPNAWMIGVAMLGGALGIDPEQYDDFERVLADGT